MKKLFNVLFAVLFLSGMIYAQRISSTEAPSALPDPNLVETKVVDAGNFSDLVPATHSFAHQLYASSPRGPISFWLNAPNPVTVLNTTYKSIYAADFDGVGTWYGIDATTAMLVTCDTATGVFTNVVSCPPSAGGNWTGMSWDKTTNTMYAVDHLTSSVLYTIDLATGAKTQIGPILGASIVIDIAINSNGEMYGHEITGDNIISINKATGVGTIIGSTTLAANFAQGMDFHPETGELFLAAYTGGGASGIYSVNLTTGAATLVGTFGVLAEVDGFAIPGGFGPPCPVGLPTNPSPADLAVDLPLTGIQLTWTNPGNATNNEVYFGTSPGSMALVSSGTLATSYNVPGTLNYFTNYYWKVVEKNDTCGVSGPVWSFKTIQDPNLFFALQDDFTAGAGNWTITNDGGTCVWTVYPTPWPNTYTMPATATGSVFAADADNCGSGTTTVTTATLTNPLDFTNYQSVELQFDNDWYRIDDADSALIDVSNDGGTTWVRYLSWNASVRNSHEIIDISATAALHNNVKIRFKSIQPGYDWWWAIDNVQIIGGDIVPVELASFKADVNGNSVTLNWATATETNNSGFDIERSINGSAYVKIGNVAGYGTTTEVQTYNFMDSKLANGTYSYRLKQIDYDGTFSYSSVVTADVNAPMVYSLDQNYPNPFNPATKISFTLAADSKVNLRVFNILGQEVAVIASGVMTAGSYNYSFDASNLNSGVYFYQLEAQGNDGSSFKSIRKMMLTK